MKNLIKVAKELNDKLGLDPEIKTKGVDEKKLKRDLLKAADLIDWDADDISPETTEELVSIGFEVPVEVLPEEPEAEEIDLVALIDKTTKLKDLKALVNEHEPFKPLRKKIPGMFETGELKEEMMELLGVTYEDAEPATESKVEKPKPKPAAVKKTEKGQSDIIREFIRAQKSKEEICKELAKTFGKTEGWANARMKTYEKAYGEMGKNDKKLQKNK